MQIIPVHRRANYVSWNDIDYHPGTIHGNPRRHPYKAKGRARMFRLVPNVSLPSAILGPELVCVGEESGTTYASPFVQPG